MSDSDSEPDLLNELANDFAERYRRGERPSLSEYTARYPELADEIRDLFPAMAVIEQLGSAGGGPYPQGATPDGPAPRQLGEYRILREVARGGMGIVYEAVQESLGRHVALKVLPFQSLSDACQLERFRREARAAAMLHHTNIVPVFGVGEHEGVHYFAMQFIRGQALNSILHELRGRRQPGWSDPSSVAAAPAPAAEEPKALELTVTLAGAMTTGQFAGHAEATRPAPPRAFDGPMSVRPTGSTTEIFGPLSKWDSRSDMPYFRSVARVGLQVVEAIAYAHGQSILHRDIKPANILLDTEGIAWVTDFGLAKAGGSVDLTGPDDLVGTLRYMAPERFRGESGPRSDVFSLGLTLYEMATLRPAFGAPERAQLIARMLHDEPPRPRTIDRRIPRDLETVILKAIAKEPSRRYQTAGELADDLRRFLADRPVRARRTRWPERFGRWCRRNPAIAGLSITAGALLITAVAVLAESNARIARSLDEKAAALRQERRALAAARSSAQAARTQEQRATENLRRARRAVDQMLTRVSQERLFELPRMEQVRRALLEDALTFYQEFLRQETTDPRLRLEAAQAHYRLAGLLRDLGQTVRAVENFRRAIAVLTPLVAEFPGEPEYRTQLADAYELLAYTLLWSGGAREAEEPCRQALALYHALAAELPTEPLRRRHEGTCEEALGRTLTVLQRYREAETECRKGLSILDGLAVEFPTESSYRIERANCQRALGTALQSAGRLPEAEGAFRQTVETWQKASAELPTDRWWQQPLCANHMELADVLLARGRRDEAMDEYRQALEVAEKLLADFPGFSEYRWRFEFCGDRLADLLKSTHPDEAETISRHIISVWEKLAADFPDRPEYRARLADVHAHQASHLRENGQPREAETALRQAIAIREILVVRFPKEPGYRNSLAGDYFELGKGLHWTRPKEAEPLYRQAISLAEPLVAEFSKVREYRSRLAECDRHLAWVLTNTGQSRLAEPICRRGLLLARQVEGEFHDEPASREVGLGQLVLGLVFHGNGCPREAEAALREAIRTQTTQVSRFPAEPLYVKELVDSTDELARQLATGPGRLSEADELHATTIELLRQAAARFPAVRFLSEQVIHNHRRWARMALEAGRPQIAQEALGEAVKCVEKLILNFPNPPALDPWDMLAETHRMLGDSLVACGRSREAETAYRESRVILAKLDADQKAGSLMARGEYAKAERIYRESLTSLREAFGPWHPGTCEALDMLATALQSQGRIGQAVAELSRTVDDRPEDQSVRHRHALALIAAGDRAGYRGACTAALDWFTGAHGPLTPEEARICVMSPGGVEAARVCVLAPGGLVDFGPPLELAEAALARDPDSAVTLYVLGLAHYRAGHHAEAIRRLTEAMKAGPRWNATALTWPVLAMAHWRLGHEAEARPWLARCRPAIGAPARGVPLDEAVSTSASWWDRAEFQLLRREAEALILDPAFPANPFVR